MSTNDLLLAKKIEEFLFEICVKTDSFPKFERYSLTQDIKKETIQLLAKVNMASSIKSKRKIYAQEADGHLQTVKILIKLFNHKRYISKGYYVDASRKLREIGKMLSGYIKSTNKN